jgi:homoserine dehydrogenase
VQLVGILERNVDSEAAKLWQERDPNLFYESLDQLLADPQVDVVVETVGGMEFARTLIRQALERQKHVVTANKDLIAVYGSELHEVARQQKRQLLFEASVTGAIPVVRLLQDYFQPEDIERIQGIFNGTSNYILTEMEQRKIPFAEALQQAQSLGYAEADPTNDIAGHDARYKLVILTYLVTGQWIPPEQITMQGIDHLELPDFEYAERMDRRIKLIGYLQQEQEALKAFVLPLMMPRHTAIAEVSGSFNIVSLQGRFSDEIALIGRGAGSLPTASAIVADLYKIAERPSAEGRVPARSLWLRPFSEYVFRHTLRFTVEDRPGIVGKVGAILSRHQINIYALEQLPQYNGSQSGTGNEVIFTLTLEPCREAVLQQALSEINELDFMRRPAAVLRELT